MIDYAERKEENWWQSKTIAYIRFLLTIQWKFHFGNICVMVANSNRHTEEKQFNLIATKTMKKKKLIKICAAAAAAALLSYD